MKHIINLILFLSISLSVDILSIELPVNAKSLSSSGYGIASKDNHWGNPASLSTFDKSYFEFSNNKWLFDVEGSYMSYINKNFKLSGYYWQVDDIEMYDDIPSSSPLSTFGSKTFFVDFAEGFNFESHQFGYNLRYAYMKLLEYEDKGFILDLGYRYSFNDFSSIAILISNLNQGFKDGGQIPQVAIIGSSQKIKKLPLIINSDIFFEYSQSSYTHDKSGIYQGLTFTGKYFDITAGYCYYSESEHLDTSLGINFLWKNLEFSISTLMKEEASIGTPVFYQLSYYLEM